MTNEQREAIDSLEKLVKLRKDKTNTIKHDTCICGTMEEQEEKIEKLKKDNSNAWQLNAKMSLRHLNDICKLKKKDKQIDLMAEMIDELSEYYTRYHGKNNEFCKEICIEKDIDCKDCIKQYFAGLVEKE